MCHSRTLDLCTLTCRPGKKTGKMGSSLPGNVVIWRVKIKKYVRGTIPHWREICPAGRKFCPACREINIFSRPADLLIKKLHSVTDEVSYPLHDCLSGQLITRSGCMHLPYAVTSRYLSSFVLQAIIKG